MKVRSKHNNKVYEVFNVKDDRRGYPTFLVYNFDNNEWRYVSAKHFIPDDPTRGRRLEE